MLKILDSVSLRSSGSYIFAIGIKIFLLALLILLSIKSFAQNSANRNDLIESLIESIAENSDENLDYTDLLEEISLLLNKPINVNSATNKDLKKLYLLNGNQIESLLQYRETSGQILSIYELQLIPGLSYELIRKIEPLICFDSKSKNASQIKRRAQHLLLLRSEKSLEKEEGYKTENPNTKYLGNSWKYYTRYQFKSPKDKLILGVTAEKDKGEPFFEDKNSDGFDFYSGYLQFKTNKFFQQIILGDFQVKFGQGLSLWSGLSGGKSSFTTQNAYKSQAIKGYHSTDENQFFRGASVLLKPAKNIKLALFASSKERDGNLNADTTDSFISSIINDGYHRNRNEMDKKHQLTETSYGAYVLLMLRKLEMGISLFEYEYSPEVRNQDQLYSYYNFQGKRNYNLSFTYETHVRSMHLYGEIAKSKSGGLAILQGANIQVHPQLNFELIYRKYDEDYHAHFSNAFGEQSKTQNEEGFYMGLEFHPFPKWTLKAYYDQFEFPWLKHSVNSPSSGHEYFSQVEFTPNEKLSLYFRYKQESKPENNHSEIIKSPVDIDRNQYRLHLSAKMDENWEIRNRLEVSNYQKEETKENGFLIYQDVIYHFSKLPVTASFRYAIFDTDSYNTRIYAYENDILYAYSIPAYYSKGSRMYLNLKYKINKNCSFYAKYSQTKYSDTESFGSGTSEISGDTKSEIKLQLRFRI